MNFDTLPLEILAMILDQTELEVLAKVWLMSTECRRAVQSSRLWQLWIDCVSNYRTPDYVKNLVEVMTNEEQEVFKDNPLFRIQFASNINEHRKTSLFKQFASTSLVLLFNLHHWYGIFSCAGNLSGLRLLYQTFGLVVPMYQHFVAACANGHLAAAEWFHTVHCVTKADSKTDYNNALYESCYHGCLHIIVWLCRTFNLDENDVRSHDNCALLTACSNKQYHVALWLKVTFGLNQQDARSLRNSALKTACIFNHHRMVRWLIVTFDLTDDDKNDAYEILYSLVFNPAFDETVCILEEKD